MANSVGVDGYIHIEGFEKFEREAFDKKKIRAAMRKAGKLVRQRAQMNIALARGQDSYPLAIADGVGRVRRWSLSARAMGGGLSRGRTT